MKDRILATLLLVVLSLAAVAGCAPASPAAPPLSPTATAPAQPVTLTDDLGRRVTIPAVPERIVSLAPSNTEILFSIGAGAQVVGVTEFCNYPPEAQSRTKVGGFSADTISIEQIVALEPDLVLSAGELQQPVIEALEQAGITVFALDPETIEAVYTAIETAGRLTGHEAEAGGVVAEMKERVAAVTAKTRAIPEAERPAVFYEVWHEPLMSAGPATFIGELIEFAGGRNLFADVTEAYPEVSTEEVVRRDPAVILGPDSHGDELSPERIGARPGWAEISAVREGRVFTLNGDIVSRPGPRLVEALEEIARLLHPDLFPKEEGAWGEPLSRSRWWG